MYGLFNKFAWKFRCHCEETQKANYVTIAGYTEKDVLISKLNISKTNVNARVRQTVYLLRNH